MQALFVSFVIFLCFSIVQSQSCSSYQTSCDACSRAGCRYVWSRPGFYNSSLNGSCITTSEFQNRTAVNQYANQKSIWAWALYDSEIKTKMGQRLLKVQNVSSYAYNALPIPCYDVHRTICRQPYGILIGRTCDSYDNSSLGGATVTCTSIRNGQVISTTSTSAGFFNFLRLRAGSYRCTANLAPTYVAVTVNVTISDRTNTTTSMCLSPLPAAITGRVYDVTTGVTLTNSVVDCTVEDTFKTLKQFNTTQTATGTYLFEGIKVFGSATCVASNFAGGYSVGQNTGVTVRGKTVVIDIPLTPNPGRLYGYSYIGDTSNPVAGVNVTCTALGKTYSQLTNSSGAYDFGIVPNATYQCTAQVTGYAIVNFSTTPTVVRGSATRQDYPLTPLPATLFGYVYDSVSRAVIRGATVQCSILTYTNFTTTGADGYYYFTPIYVYDRAACNASASGYKSSTFYYNITALGVTTEIDIPLDPLPGRLYGFAYVNGTTTPIPGVNITCTSAALRITLTQITGANGGYDFGDTKNATYTCTATLQDYASPPAVDVLVPQATTIRQDFFLRLAVGDLVVKVVEAFTQQQVLLIGSNVTLSQYGSVIGINSTALPDSLTIFRRVRPGFYNLSTSYPDYSPFIRSDILVNQTGACVNSTYCPNGIVLLEVFPLNSSISGRVRNRQSAVGLPNCQLELIITRSAGNTSARGTTDTLGRFFISIGTSNLGGGFGNVLAWTLVASCSGYDQDSQPVNITGPNRYISGIIFDLNVTTTGNVLLLVVDSTNDAIVIPNANVTFFDSAQPAIYRTTNSSGYAFVTRVNAGSRTLYVSSPLYESQVVTITVGAGDPGTNVNKVQLKLKRGTINVKVFDSVDRTSRPGTYPIQCKENSLKLEIQPISDPENEFKNIDLPIGTRNLTIETPLYNSFNLIVNIVEGVNPPQNVYLVKIGP